MDTEESDIINSLVNFDPNTTKYYISNFIASFKPISTKCAVEKKMFLFESEKYLMTYIIYDNAINPNKIIVSEQKLQLYVWQNNVSLNDSIIYYDIQELLKCVLDNIIENIHNIKKNENTNIDFFNSYFIKYFDPICVCKLSIHLCKINFHLKQILDSDSEPDPNSNSNSNLDNLESDDSEKSMIDNLDYYFVDMQIHEIKNMAINLINENKKLKEKIKKLEHIISGYNNDL